MGDDTVDDLLFLIFWNVIDVPSFMKLCLAATIAFCSVQYLIDVNLVVAARIFIRRSERPVKVHLDFRCDRMVPTVSHLCNRVVFMASITLDEVQVGPDLPVDLFP